MSENFAELLDDNLKSIEMKPGTIVSGVVLAVDKDWVTVHVGLKSEGVISLDEFKDCLLYTSPSPRDLSTSRMPSSA